MKRNKKQGDDQRAFDNTSLRESTHGSYVHRDYAAHFFRWGFASRFINHKSRALEIGCGRDQPLVRLLTATGKHPIAMTAVDHDDFAPKRQPAWLTVHTGFDFTTRWKELRLHEPFDVIVCLEVIEHMQKPSGLKLLKGARELLSPHGVFLLSTPIYDGKQMAQNHIHEWYGDELTAAIAKSGLVIERRFGTFQTTLQAKQARPAHRAVWAELREYYSDDVLACFLAPLYPELSRNNLWVLKKGER